MAAPRVRRKFDKPDAAAMLSGVMLESINACTGKKKQDIPMPCTRRGDTTFQKVTSSVIMLFQTDTDPITANEKVARIRKSSFPILRPIIGESSSVKTPIGAVAIPACAAV